jgi:hypothetical protein
MSLLKLRPIIFGLSIFDLIWMWALAVERLAQNAFAFEKHVPRFRFYEEVFFGSLLLLASLALLLNRRWSHWVALILSGFSFYCIFIFRFWKLADLAEVRMFSYEHFSIWYPNMYPGQLLQIALSTVILGCAVASLTESIRRRKTPNDV